MALASLIKNYAAFNEADTQLKAPRGGKGVGRFLWLKAFDRVEVDSTYRQDGSVTRGAFDFSLMSEEGVSNHRFEPVSDTAEQCTTVRLLGMKEEYEKECAQGCSNHRRTCC